MSHLKQALSLPVCVAAICCSSAEGPSGQSTAPEPQAESKQAQAHVPPERLRHADFSAPAGFSEFRNTEPESPAANAPAPWRPKMKLDAGLPSASEWKASDTADTLAPAKDKPAR